MDTMPTTRTAAQRYNAHAGRVWAQARATMNVQAFAERLEREQRERLAREYPKSFDLAKEDEYRATVHAGPKYTKVDFNHSGKYMVVNATGEIFGIKAYGVIHRGHAYGTLDTIDQWDWSGYAAVRIPPKAARI